MRGKDNICENCIYDYRITPAHAGKSNTFQVEETGKEDHPRTCGEKLKVFCNEISSLGSPPHMRGKVKVRKSLTVLLRITPAHAGKRVFRKSISVRIGDHPRTCGEKGFHTYTYTNKKGSPPHMRGKGNSYAKLCT